MKEFIPGTNEPNPNINQEENLIQEANNILSNGKAEAHKRKKAEKRRHESKKDRSIEKRLRLISINPDTLETVIKFDEVVTLTPEDEDSESSAITNKYSVKSPRRPHSDFMNQMRKLRNYAMELAEINDENAIDYVVGKVKVRGDMLMKQSRVSMTMYKKVKRTGKNIPIEVSEVVMYGESDYDKAEKMSRVIEELEREAWLYIGGKYMDETPNQLPLFK